MEIITDTQAESLRGGRLFSITVAPTIVVSNAISTALQGNVGNAFALSGLVRLMPPWASSTGC
jgi:hypothetical protein